jgi:NAD(P)-dependent dehydrogenase (short-subunit alcohol dehydrogenase family)
MKHKPKATRPEYVGSGKLAGKRVLITGGDSGIGRATAILCAREGAAVAIGYLNEHKDAREAKRLVENEGVRCELYPGDIGDEKWCKKLASQVVKDFGGIDVLINNASEQHPQDSLMAISAQQWQRTFTTNVFGIFCLTKAVLPHLQKDSAIINTASVVAYRGHPELIDYAATKGAIITFTRSMALSLASKGIRVNAVAPGPIWTPLITSTFPPDKVKTFGKDRPLGRPGQPEEVAPAFIFLASADSSYITGQTIHVNGGDIVNG